MPIAGQRASDVAGGAPLTDPKRDVDSVGHQIDASVGNEDLKRHRWISPTEGAEELPQRLEVGWDGDAQPTGHTLRVVKPLFCLRERRKRSLSIRHELVARRGQREASRTSLEQANAEVVFQLAQLPTEGR